MEEKLQQLHSNVLKFKANPSIEQDIRNNLVLQADILLLLETMFKELQEQK